MSGERLLTALVTRRSAIPLAFTVAALLSFSGFGSSDVCADTAALFVIADAASTRATSVRVADAAALIAPIVQLPEEYVPCEALLDTSDSPAGSESVIDTPAAWLGPRLVAVTVNVTLSPMDAVARSAVLVTDTSAADAVFVIAAAESFDVFGSCSCCPVLTARFAIDPGVVTLTFSISCGDAFTAIDPTSHTPVVASNAPCVGTAESSCNPLGR